MPRVAPITGKSDVPAEYHDVVDGVLKVFGQIRGPFSMLLHSPKLAERVLNLGNFFRSDSIVEPKDRSLAILVLPTTRWPQIRRHVPEVVAAVASIQPGEFRELNW